jgi:pyruvate,water dikinase
MQAKSDFILTLTDATANLAQVGGKGASLARMANAGLPVPAAFFITTDAYRCFVDINGIQPRILEALHGKDFADPVILESVSRLIQSYFTEGCIPVDVENAISAAYFALKGIPVAVRSSATAEDLPEASFAGQQETYLNICGADAVLDSVKKCWASLWTARAIAYRAKQAIDPNCVALAVVVQEMVNAEASGILFTANPINGHRDEMVINAAWGLGEAIVGGLVSPDTIVADKATSKVKKYDVAEKTVLTVLTESGTREEKLEGVRRKSQVMNEAQVRELVGIARRIESFYGSPQDIEWCFANGKFFIVQSRPITALPPEPLEWKIPVPKAVLARGSFAEFVPEPVSPMFATLAVPIARETTNRMMNRLGMTMKDGYVFAIVNRYLYIGFVFTFRITWEMIKGSFVMLRPILRTSRQQAVTARAKFLNVIRRWQVRDLKTLKPSELLIGVREIFTETAEFYNMAQSATIPNSMAGEGLFTLYYNALVKRKGDPQASMFVFGTENQAMCSEKALFDLTTWAKGYPELDDYLTRTPSDLICRALRADPQPDSGLGEFSTCFNSYLKEFGHAIYDLDFAKPVPADSPAPLIETIKVYLSGKNNPYERQRAVKERQAQAVERITKRLDPLRRKWFLQSMKWAQDTAPLREDSIADVGLGHPQIRRMLGELGRRLAAGNAIACADDIYWLEANEAEAQAALLEKGDALQNFEADVQTRKAECEAMKRIMPPNTLPAKTFLAKFYANEGQAAGHTIKGFAASAGKVTARACVMLGPEDFGKMQNGDVIVAGITTPAWTPLFARASAIVTDIGGPLSHSSIVAREYGIPAVLATGVGTRRIHTGQVIIVDGSAGTVDLK